MSNRKYSNRIFNWNFELETGKDYLFDLIPFELETPQINKPYTMIPLSESH